MKLIDKTAGDQLRKENQKLIFLASLSIIGVGDLRDWLRFNLCVRTTQSTPFLGATLNFPRWDTPRSFLSGYIARTHCTREVNAYVL